MLPLFPGLDLARTMLGFVAELFHIFALAIRQDRGVATAVAAEST